MKRQLFWLNRITGNWNSLTQTVVNCTTVRSFKQEAQGLGPLLDKMEDNDHIKMDNIDVFRCIFHSKTCRFRGTRFLKSGNTPNDSPNYLNYLTSHVSCTHWILTPRPKFQSISLYDQPFSRYRLVENQNAPNNPRITLITEGSKVHCVHWILNPEAQILLRFALRPAVFEILLFTSFCSTVAPFPDNWGFWFHP